MRWPPQGREDGTGGGVSEAGWDEHRGYPNLQGTVAREVRFCGVGLHSGSLVELRVYPARPNSGIRFCRSPLSQVGPSQEVAATVGEVSDTQLSTTIGKGTSRVSTIEHLMAAFSGLGINNALVEVSAGEVPILDGSAAPFVDTLAEVGIQFYHEPVVTLIAREPIHVSDNHGGYMMLQPWENPVIAGQPVPLRIDYEIDFAQSQAIGSQRHQFWMRPGDFRTLAEARTFCHVDDVTRMRARGLALGGSLDNAVVVDGNRVLNVEGLRFDSEFVKHKILDCLGDLALLPGRLSGHLTAVRAGHALHHRFATRLLESAVISWTPSGSDLDQERHVQQVAPQQNLRARNSGA